MATGLLQQLPSLDGLTQLRATIGAGLDETLGRLGDLGDLAGAESPLRPLAEALESAGAAPDLGALLGPLAAAREGLGAAMPADLSGALDAVGPLLDALSQLVEGSAVAPILDDLRAGRSITEVARAALGQVLDQALGRLPELLGGAIGGEARGAIDGLLAAAGALSGDAAPEAVAAFLAERLLGLPLAPIARIAELRAGLAGAAADLPELLGADVATAAQTMTLSLNAAADRLAAGPADSDAWAGALGWLRQARDELGGLREAMRAVPAAAEAALATLDPARYAGELRDALRGLAAGAPGRQASLEQLVQGLIDPLDQLTAAIGPLSPGAFSAQLRAQLDALGALLDAMGEQARSNPVLDLFADVQEVVAAIAAAIGAVRRAIEAGLAALLAAADEAIALVDGARRQVEGALAALGQALVALDIAGLTAEVEAALGQIGALLEQLPADELRAALDTALTTVDGLVGQLAEVAEAAIGQAEPLVAALEQIDLERDAAPIVAALGGLRDLIAGVDLSMLPDGLRGELDAVVDPFLAGLRGSLDEIMTTLEQGLGALTAELGGLSDRLEAQLERLSDAIGALDPRELLAPLADGFAALRQALGGLSGAAALAPLGERLADLRAGLERANPARLLAPIEAAFEDQVLAPARALRPSELLAPLAEAMAPVEALLGQLDMAEAIGGLGAAAGELVGAAHGQLSGALGQGDLPGLGGLADGVRPVLDLLRPGATIDEWAVGLNELLGSYRPDAALRPVLEALRPLDDWLAGADDARLLAAFGRLQGQLRTLDGLELPEALLRAPLERAAAMLEAQRPAALAAVLAAPYTRLGGALAGIDRAALPAELRAGYDEAAGIVAALDPAPILAPMGPVFARLPGRLRALAAAPTGLTELRAEFSGALGLASGAFPAFLRGELTPEGLRAGLAALSPSALARRLDERFAAFLAAAERFGPAIQAVVEAFMGTLGERVAALSPAALLERIDELFAPIRAALAEIAPAAIGAALDATYQELITRLEALHPRTIREPAQALFDAAAGQLDALRAQLIDALGAAIDRALGQIRALAERLDPAGLIAGLGNLLGLIRERLASLGLGALLDRLMAALGRLATGLAAALTRVGAGVAGLAAAV